MMQKLMSIMLACLLLGVAAGAVAEENVGERGAREGGGMRAGGGAGEHMTSFDYAYKLDAVRAWLFAQSK